MTANRNEAQAATPFSEKGFYLGEFRGRTLAVTASASELGSPEPLREVLAELGANATRVVLISNSRDALAGLIDAPVVPADAPRLEGVVWHGLRKASFVGVCVDPGGDFARHSAQIALRLGVTKLVWIDRDGAVLGDDGRRLSFVDLGELRKIRSANPGGASRRAVILREVESLLGAGIPAVNLCSLEGLADELFTYAGSGTLFSRERYVEVRRLGIDDFDAADDLIARGVAEGYLAPRSPEAVERVLANGFGAFVEGRHLAGIGALLHWEQAKAAEILKDAAKKELTSGRGPTGVAAAAIYISSILCNERRTQREVADIAGVTEVTIRNRYKELTEKLGIEVQL